MPWVDSAWKISEKHADTHVFLITATSGPASSLRIKKEKSENVRAIRKLRDILSPIIESEEKWTGSGWYDLVRITQQLWMT